MKRSNVIAVALLLSALFSRADAALPATGAPRVVRGSLTFEPCTLAQAGLAQTVAARCAKLQVPEDRSRPDGRRLELAIAWVPAAAKRATPDPVFFLAGGPGQSALEAYPLVADAFRDVQRKRDVILVDQRGSGGSHPLECPQALDPERTSLLEFEDADAARTLTRECLAEIHDADLRYYATSDYIADLEAVRDALKVERVNLVGGSYGTRVALEYLRRHPQRVRTVTLDSVVPATLILGSEHARNLENAVDAQFARCDLEPTCRDRFGTPRRRLDALIARLKEHPVPVTYRDPLTQEPRQGELTAEAVAGVVRLYAYSPQIFGMLPMLLDAAASGRYEGLMEQSKLVEQMIGEQFYIPLGLSVSCTEDAPWLKANPADRNTLLGTSFAEFMVAQCSVWPRREPPRDFHAPVAAPSPALLLSGEFDPVTPPRYGDEVARTLPQSRHFVLRGQGHGVLGVGCVPQLFAEFIERADAKRLDGSCLERLEYTPPFGGSYGWEP